LEMASLIGYPAFSSNRSIEFECFTRQKASEFNPLVLALPIIILLHFAFSVWVAYAKVLSPATPFPSKTIFRRYAHVTGFLIAVLSATITILLYSVNIFTPRLASIAGLTFGLNGFAGLLLVPTIHPGWLSWRRLFTIGGIFNVAGGVCVALLMYPSYPLYIIHKYSMAGLFVVCLSEFTINVITPSSSNYRSYEAKSHFGSFIDFLSKQGQLPNKNFFRQLAGVQIAILVTILYIITFWPFMDYTTYRNLSLETRMTGAVLLIVSIWGNSLSTLGPTLMYRGKMERVWALMMYNCFAFPIPQITAFFILFHPLNFGGNFDAKIMGLRPVHGPVLWAMQ